MKLHQIRNVQHPQRLRSEENENDILQQDNNIKIKKIIDDKLLMIIANKRLLLYLINTLYCYIFFINSNIKNPVIIRNTPVTFCGFVFANLHLLLTCA